MLKIGYLVLNPLTIGADELTIYLYCMALCCIVLYCIVVHSVSLLIYVLSLLLYC